MVYACLICPACCLECGAAAGAGPAGPSCGLGFLELRNLFWLTRWRGRSLARPFCCHFKTEVEKSNQTNPRTGKADAHFVQSESVATESFWPFAPSEESWRLLPNPARSMWSSSLQQQTRGLRDRWAAAGVVLQIKTTDTLLLYRFFWGKPDCRGCPLAGAQDRAPPWNGRGAGCSGGERSASAPRWGQQTLKPWKDRKRDTSDETSKFIDVKYFYL